MRLDYLHICGFRGFRTEIRINFGPGFTVIAGRNGVGKSTVFDAIEFAITGAIEKYAVGHAASESVADYIWWRGDGKPEAHYVTLGFRDKAGGTFVLTRTQEGVNHTPERIAAALCHHHAPDDVLRQLIKTSVIRDEWIAALSLDLTETERFDLVRSALGSIEGVGLGARAAAVVRAAEEMHDQSRDRYEQARLNLEDQLTQQADAKASLADNTDTRIALDVIEEATSHTPVDLAQKLIVARANLVDRRLKLSLGWQALDQARQLVTRQEEVFGGEAKARQASLEISLRDATEKLKLAELAIVEAEQRVTHAEGVNEVAASLARLIEHGDKLGLHNEGCPLCAAHQSEEQFQKGIQAARNRLAHLSADVGGARKALSEAHARAQEVRSAFQKINTTLASLDEQAKAVVKQLAAHTELVQRSGFKISVALAPADLEAELVVERNRLIELERAIVSLEASRNASTLTALDRNIAVLRAAADEAAISLSRSEAAVSSAKAIERAVRLVSVEIVDERLAMISPLLNELYERLRPHSDWKTIDYKIRGAIRRFLSLKVGADLNPQFVFSSGQRRAAGLAFLLSVYLARSWARWTTLLLDDPVQHIDDFRALQLVEVLSAIRLSGRQIVCAVEDEALADLICRRLLSTSEEAGVRHEIDYGADGLAAVVATREVAPMPVGVILNAARLQTAG